MSYVVQPYCKYPLLQRIETLMLMCTKLKTAQQVNCLWWRVPMDRWQLHAGMEITKIGDNQETYRSYHK